MITFSGHYQPPGAEEIIRKEDYPECYIPRPVILVHSRLHVTDEGDGGHVPTVKISFPWTLKDMVSWQDGSWQNAFLTQPPQKEIPFKIANGTAHDSIFGSDLCRPKHKYLEVCDAEGVRFGEVIQSMRTLVFPQRSKKGSKKKMLRSKVIRTCFRLERYQTVSFEVTPAVLPAGCWVSEARKQDSLSKSPLSPV